ncbi:aminopeptidase [Allopusillimonas soli]|uniref:M55 family metallopeptidase n=1 Tax=Allopusillimonas soli TaxID=659016 RepID=A0A853F4H1_9BURK|nr:M55 family metallopeptidase [Allopusillimonas soli]NYT35375.1 M55 family metallopeptidase [Allopusillimonas soli]TEA75792.1 aminopeptidase [Allopusillimonas soli]
MKILVSVDIEGVAGVTHVEQVRPGNPEYERARAWMTAEADAAIRGAFDGGATEVWVNDSHGGFRNLLLDRMDERAFMVTGKPRYLGMVAGVEGCDAVFLIGYHAGAGHEGVLAHTINSAAFRCVTVNGEELNEAGLYGALAAELGTPVALMSGDDVFIAETQARFPGAIAVQTKRAKGQSTCVSLSPAQSCREIRAAAARAMAAAPSLQARRMSGSVMHCELRTQTPGQADLFCQWPELRREDATALSFDAPTMEAVIRVLNCLSAMSFMLR